MLDVLHNCGFPCHTRYDGGDILATLDITAPHNSHPARHAATRMKRFGQ